MQDSTLLILNGPGLADLSAGGPQCGDLTLEQVQDGCSARCEQLGLGLDFRQTDDQEEMIRWIAKDSEDFAGLIINPVGYIKADDVDIDMYRSAIGSIAHLKKPVVEVHMTNIFKEGDESTRPLQVPEGEMGFICGLGKHSYLLAINAIAKNLEG